MAEMLIGSRKKRLVERNKTDFRQFVDNVHY